MKKLPEPSGRLLRSGEGVDLRMTRTFNAPIEDVWASMTEPDRTARWIGPWTGTPAVGETVMVRMTEEESADPSAVKILACDPPRCLVVETDGGDGSIWQVRADLVERDGATELHFSQHLDRREDAGSIGPGWEFYLDRLVASRVGGMMPEWDDYFPAQSAYYDSLAVEEV